MPAWSASTPPLPASASDWPSRSTTPPAGSCRRSCARAASGAPSSASPAGAGRCREDLLVEVDGTPVTDAGDLQRLMVGEAIGRPIRVRVFRGGELVELTLVPVELER